MHAVNDVVDSNPVPPAPSAPNSDEAPSDQHKVLPNSQFVKEDWLDEEQGLGLTPEEEHESNAAAVVNATD